jgi:hypothetical protein
MNLLDDGIYILAAARVFSQTRIMNGHSFSDVILDQDANKCQGLAARFSTAADKVNLWRWQFAKK